MKEEILRMEGISCRRNGVTLIDDMRLTLRKGETMGLLMKNAHRRSSVASLLSGELPVDSGRIYYNDKQIDSDAFAELCKRRVATIPSTLIESLTVAENMFMIRPGVRVYLVRKARLREQARLLLGRFGLEIDADKPVSRLTTFEKMVVQLTKAYASGARVLLLSDLSRELGPLEVDTLMRCVEKVKAEGFGVFLSDAYSDVLMKYTDRLSVFSGHRVVKVFRREAYDTGALSLLLEDSRLPGRTKPRPDMSHPTLSLHGVRTESLNDVSMSVFPGEVVSLLDMDSSGVDQIAALLVGECGLLSGRIELCGGSYVRRSQANAIKRGLGIIGDDPTRTSLFRDHSVMDSLSLPISSRIPGFFSQKRFELSLREQCLYHFPPEVLNSRTLHPLTEETLLKIVYVRWLVMRPKAMVIVRPLAMADAACSRVIRESIAAMAAAGSAVLILSYNQAEARLLSHRILPLKRGRITSANRPEPL
ncbi:MAG: ATP-binding cassette domain-containing protein [Clostridia bacterium]|nr:ATP-binding cassette domain-containing protein [Clostridia bacterium]